MEQYGVLMDRMTDVWMDEHPVDRHSFAYHEWKLSRMRQRSREDEWYARQ